MAAQPNVWMNGTLMSYVFANGVEMNDAYMNAVWVYTNTLHLTMSQQSAPFNLTNWINSNNPLGRRKVIVTNSLTQPAMETGNLSHTNGATGTIETMDVEFINNGEIQGSSAGGTGMNIQGSIKITNNGWIRGAGGNGGKGGNGAKGATGAIASSKIINYTKTVHYPAVSYDDPPTTSRGGWSSPGGQKYLRGPCGSTAYINWSSSSSGSGTLCGARWTARRVGSSRWHITGGASNVSVSSNHTIPGGAGGAGGAGGTGGAGGIGQYFNHPKTNGIAGSAGNVGLDGKRNSWKDPSGTTHYGNYGKKGETGKKGYTGGSGGTWGTDGAIGDGSGANGTAAGKATVGWGKVKAGSKIGNMSGSRT